MAEYREPAIVLVTLAGGFTSIVTVDYATRDGTAKVGISYVATRGTLAFAPLERAKTIDIPILDDHLVQSDVEFRVSLSHPTGGGALGLSAATVTVRNTDPGFEPGGIVRGTNGAVSLSFSPLGQGLWVVLGSTNLLDWVPLGSAGPTFTDTQAPLYHQRFYRAQQVHP